MRYLVFFFICSILITSCEYDYHIIEPSSSTPTITPGANPISFNGVIVPIFTANCAISSCHSGTASPNLTASNAWDELWFTGKKAPYVDTVNVTSSLLYKAITGASGVLAMPLGAPSLSQANIDSIYLWIAEGAKNN